MFRRLRAAAIAAVACLLVASSAGAATRTREPSVHPTISVNSATTIEQIMNADDFTFGDAATLRLYRAFFDRDADVDGARYWMQQSRNGATPDDLAYGFAQSQEFRNRYGTLGNAQFVDLLYRNMLGRSPDPAGFTYWTGLLDRGQLSQHGVVRWIVANTEFITRYPFHPPATSGRAWFPRITATTVGDLVGVPLKTAEASAEAALIRALGEPTQRVDWQLSCEFASSTWQSRWLMWGNLTVTFERDLKAGVAARFSSWQFTLYTAPAPGGPSTVYFSGGLKLGDSLASIASSQGSRIEFDDLLEEYATTGSPRVTGPTRTGRSTGVFVPWGGVCD